MAQWNRTQEWFLAICHSSLLLVISPLLPQFDSADAISWDWIAQQHNIAQGYDIRSREFIAREVFLTLQLTAGIFGRVCFTFHLVTWVPLCFP